MFFVRYLKFSTLFRCKNYENLKSKLISSIYSSRFNYDLCSTSVFSRKSNYNNDLQSRNLRLFSSERQIEKRLTGDDGKLSCVVVGVESYFINEAIKHQVVRVVYEGTLVGDIETSKAIGIAKERGKSLILIKQHSQPPLCKIADVEEFLKKEEKKKLTKKTFQEKQINNFAEQYNFDPSLKVKIIRMNNTCALEDMKRKIKQARDFICNGHRLELQIVKVKTISCEETVKKIEFFIGQLKDVSKPVNLPVAKNAFLQNKVNIIKIWPCKPEHLTNYAFPPVLDEKMHSNKISGLNENLVSIESK